jgi:hypothetical protein
MQTIFFRLLAEDDKDGQLAQAILNLRQGREAEVAHEVDSDSFRQVPGSPFAYWIGESVLGAWRSLASLEEAGVLVRSTNPLNEDFRYFRLWWEVPAKFIGRERGWIYLSKGGDYSKYYSDVHLLAAWDDEEGSYRGFTGTVNRPLKKPASLDWFFLPGLTYSRRSQIGFSARALPAGAIFHDKGPGIFPPNSEHQVAYLAILNSRPFCGLLDMQVSFGSYEVGVIQRTPVPDIRYSDSQVLSRLASKSLNLKRDLDRTNEVSHVFLLPALLQVPGTTLADRIAAWGTRVSETERQLAENQREIDDIAFRLYGIEGEDRAFLEGPGARSLSSAGEETEPSEEDEP